MNRAFFNDLISSVASQGRRLLNSGKQVETMNSIADNVAALLSEQGEAKGVAVAQQTLDTYQQLDEQQRIDFFNLLVEQYGCDHEALAMAIENYRQADDNVKDGLVIALRRKAEPRRYELFKRLNLAPGGIASLLSMREQILSLQQQYSSFALINNDLHSLFSSWFNRGFLVLQRIDWNTPAAILEKIIKYEAVHEITSWNDLRRRIELPDRRCYAFFHPTLNDEPLIFVEVALTKGIANAIVPILSEAFEPLNAYQADTAVFYSISNCQKGLQGITFGNFLIKQVVQELKRDVDNIKEFVTLSPMPNFNRWLESEQISDEQVEQEGLTALALMYLTEAKNKQNKPYDPVARFHLGNGARLQQINENADLSVQGIKQSRGLMVNYLYDLDTIEQNHEQYINDDNVALSKELKKRLK